MKELLFSLTKKDFRITFFCAGGPGGQNQNKVSTACRIIHPDSGAIGISREHRTQLQNKKAAFERLVKTKEFQTWHKIEVARHLGKLADVERQVSDWMKPENLMIEEF